MSLLRLVMVAALILSAAGCALREPLRPAALPPASDVLMRIRARRRLSSFRSLVSFEMHLPAGGASGWSPGQELGLKGRTFAGRAVLLWKAPDALRLEPLSPLGAPIFVVVAKGLELRAFSAGRGRFYIGRADTEAMSRWVGVPLESALLVRIFQGALPALSGEQRGAARLAWDGEAGALRLELPPGRGLERRQVAWLDPESWEPRSVRIGEEGAAIEVRYGPFRRLRAGSVPEWTEVVDPRRVQRMRIELSAIDEGATRELPDALFDLPVPPGVVVVPLERGASK